MIRKTNAIILQSGGPTTVINSTVAGIITGLKASRNVMVDKIFGAKNGMLGVLNEELFDLKMEDQENIWLLRETPSSALGSCRYKVDETDLERILRVLIAHKIRYVFIAGGNDSMDTANKLDKFARFQGYELLVIGTPKTVDNDLCYTDHCPGYGSAARWWATVTRDAGLDTEAIYTSDPVKILETVGRNSGWVAASAALAKEYPDDAPHLIYLPEVPFEEARFLQDVGRAHKRLGRVVVVVCEGIKNKDGKTVVESKRTLESDAFGHPQRGGVSSHLAELIIENIGIKARWEKPGTIQRVSMVCASGTDLTEAYTVGARAAAEALIGNSGVMVSLVRLPGIVYRWKTNTVPLEFVANQEKKIPQDMINREGNFVTEKFLKYARPLIGGPLPKYARLERKLIRKRLKPYKRNK